MQNRTPVPRDERPALPDFAPVPRHYRHDGWTPERQKAFIEALADTGSVTRAAAAVNMGLEGCYTLRRAPGAEGLRRAWDVALGLGVGKLKDLAFERAIEGELVPVFHRGKLQGFRRKRNDALLMFCLRHYGQDANGKRTTINYFKASAAAGAGEGSAGAAASTTTVQTVIRGDGADASPERDDRLAATLEEFAGVPLDPLAQQAIAAALEDCALRAREARAAMDAGGETAVDAAMADGDEPFVSLPPLVSPYRGELEPPIALEDMEPFGGDEAHWIQAGAERPALPEIVPAPAPPAPTPARRRKKAG